MLDRVKAVVSKAAFRGLMASKALWSPVALGASALIVDRSGKVLLARHSYIRAGRCLAAASARGEPPAAAILRELKEEIGDGPRPIRPSWSAFFRTAPAG